MNFFGVVCLITGLYLVVVDGFVGKSYWWTLLGAFCIAAALNGAGLLS